MFIVRLFDKIDAKLATHSSSLYISYLRRKGIKIGVNTTCNSPSTVMVDLTRPSLIKIGDNVKLNRNTTLLTHDYVTAVMKITHNEFINSSGPIVIGNNVGFGHNVTVLKGVTIGDNCFIGCGSIVTKNIPSNSLAVGCPAKVIYSIDEYYQKRKVDCTQEAFEYARSIVARFNRRPVVEDFWEEFPLFVNGDNVDQYPTVPIKRQLGDTYDYWIKNHKKTFADFDAFLKAAGID